MLIALFIIGCGPKNSDITESQVQPSNPPETPSESPVYNIILDDVQLQAKWDDGDTFSAYVQDGEQKKKIKARMNGYNTLESYGPVHSWGDWTEQELYVFAKESGVVADAGQWNCIDLKTGGGYGRLLVDCPDLRSQLLREGYAHPFAVENPAPSKDLEDMKFAMDNKKGIWEKGVPQFLITSLHSQAEHPETNEDGSYKKNAYNRVCDLQNGQCAVREHNDTYEVCQKVCIEDSCMLYVPYENRYKKDSLAECLKMPASDPTNESNMQNSEPQ